ncbi:Bug family tripartite tricarboxylate transporter substrate binding protein [Sneathiella sp.]|uniref:Bug family tripartite tricarboxylate transporter substrate binding protein n=1 Tax=Sneathiella sp. TaxID=1964365 RepID=UPI003564A4DD
MKRTGKILAGAIALATAFAVQAPIAQASIDCDTVRMIVPWKAGGGTDRLGRGLAVALEKVSGKSVIVDNISGASSVTGSVKAINAKPDGCTILMNGSTEMVAFMTFKQNLPIDLDKMKYVGAFYNTPTWLVSHKDRGYSSFEDFAAKAKANPGTLTIGVGGATGALMIMASGIKGYGDLDVTIVPYSGGADLKKAMLANQVDAGVIHSPVLLKEVKAGMINVLTAGGELTNIEYPEIRNVPTLESLGIPVKVAAIRGIFVPVTTPDEVVAELAGWLESAIKDPEFIEFGKKFGYPPVWINGEDFRKGMYHDKEAYKKIYEAYIKG